MSIADADGLRPSIFAREPFLFKSKLTFMFGSAESEARSLNTEGSARRKQ